MTEDLSRSVSRETLERLQQFHDLVVRWTRKINLISINSVSDIWNRHIWDSVQVAQLESTSEHWVDLGSGGGFPGIVVAIVSKEDCPDRRVTLIESDRRKCAFLRDVGRRLNLETDVISERIEAVPGQAADIVSARALADLNTLLGHCARHLAPDGVAFLPKGAQWEKEVAEARRHWSFDLAVRTSRTDAAAAILEVRNVSRV